MFLCVNYCTVLEFALKTKKRCHCFLYIQSYKERHAASVRVVVFMLDLMICQE